MTTEPVSESAEPYRRPAGPTGQNAGPAHEPSGPVGWRTGEQAGPTGERNGPDRGPTGLAGRSAGPGHEPTGRVGGADWRRTSERAEPTGERAESAGRPGGGSAPPWRGIHRALADPLRIRLFEALWHGPRSAKELAASVDLPPDRVYYHLRQLERARIIEVGEYRPLASGRVERLYRRVRAEPPQVVASPQEVAAFLGSVLDASQADISAAFLAKEAGRRREVYVSRGPVRLTDEALAELQAFLDDLRRRFTEPDDAGTWASVLFTLIDLEDRPPPPRAPEARAPEAGAPEERQ